MWVWWMGALGSNVFGIVGGGGGAMEVQMARWGGGGGQLG